MFGKTILGLALSFTPFVVMAEQPYVDIEQRLTTEQRRATGLDTLSPVQLELLNRLLRGESATAVQSGYSHGDEEPVHASNSRLDDKQISSRLQGSVSGWEPGTVFELENGQRWKVLKGSAKLPKALQAPEVLVVPGVAGRWFMQVVEDLPKARVYRID